MAPRCGCAALAGSSHASSASLVRTPLSPLYNRMAGCQSHRPLLRSQAETIPAGTILSVDMMGILLVVCNTSYYLCPCCLKLCIWNADGYDLCPMMLAGGGRAPFDSGDADDPCSCYVPAVPQAGHAHPRCVVCAGRHIGRHVVTVPDHSRKAVVVSCFCSRHMPPPHIMANVHNMQDLVDAVRARL